MIERRVFGVLVTFRRERQLEATLRQLGAQSKQLDVLIVVDNASQDSKVERALEDINFQGTKTIYLAMAENTGPAGGIAAGMRRALELGSAGDLVMVLDDDDPPPDNSVFEEIFAAAEQLIQKDVALGGLALAGATFDARNGRLTPVRPAVGEVLQADYLKSGWFATYPMEAVQRVGVFDSSLFFGLDDVEFGLRLRKAGFTLCVIAPAVRGSGPAVRSRPRKRLDPWDWRKYYSFRNLLVILLRNGHGYSAARVALTVGILKPALNVISEPGRAAMYLRSNLRAIRDIRRGNLGRTIEPDGHERSIKLGPNG